MIRKTEPFELKESPDVPDLILRNLQKTDGKMLGNLMYASYLGTVDYEGETLEETLAAAESTLEGQYGAIIFDASFIAFQKDKETFAIAVSVLTDFEKTGPFTGICPHSSRLSKEGTIWTLNQTQYKQPEPIESAKDFSRCDEYQ